MPTVAFLTAAVALSGVWLLLAAGIGHLRNRVWLRAVLSAQGTLPIRLRPLVVAALGPVEILLGLACLGLTILQQPGHKALLLVLAATYVAFGVATAVVVRRSPGAPCGCFSDQTPASWATVTRSAVLAVAAAVTAMTTTQATGLCLAAGAVVAVVLWVLPQVSAATTRR